MQFTLTKAFIFSTIAAMDEVKLIDTGVFSPLEKKRSEWWLLLFIILHGLVFWPLDIPIIFILAARHAGSTVSRLIALSFPSTEHLLTAATEPAKWTLRIVVWYVWSFFLSWLLGFLTSETTSEVILETTGLYLAAWLLYLFWHKHRA